MNALEIQYLNKSNLSHIARSLYMLYLRPKSEQNQCLTDLSSIASYLSSDSTYFPTTPNFEVACLVLNELEHAGLIKKEKKMLHGKVILLSCPCLLRKLKNFLQNLFI